GQGPVGPALCGSADRGDGVDAHRHRGGGETPHPSPPPSRGGGEEREESQYPLNTGARFSTKARAASLWSSVSPVRIMRAASESSASERLPSSATFMFFFTCHQATRGPAASLRAKAMVSASRLASSITRLARPSFSICSAFRISAVKYSSRALALPTSLCRK